MPLYELTPGAISPVPATRFSEAGVREREGLQRVLREKIEVISPGTLVVAEEFCEWEESRRRIDLLGIDSDANLVVIELKRTEDGSHMELQALRYAAMISALTFERVVEIFASYLRQRASDIDARSMLLDHLGWQSAEDGEFAATVRIILASADFGKELTTAVLWLNDQGLDIRCVRLVPYSHGGSVLVDIQQIIPLPEAGDYTVRIRAKQQEARIALRSQQRDFSKFILTLGDQISEPLNKRRSVFEVVRYLISEGHTPEAIQAALPAVEQNRSFLKRAAHLDESGFIASFSNEPDESRRRNYLRYFHERDELFHHGGNTYALTKMWGASTQQVLASLAAAFPKQRILFQIIA